MTTYPLAFVQRPLDGGLPVKEPEYSPQGRPVVKIGEPLLGYWVVKMVGRTNIRGFIFIFTPGSKPILSRFIIKKASNALLKS